MIMGFMTFVIGMLADVMSANRKLIEDVQYHVRKLAYDSQDYKAGYSVDIEKIKEASAKEEK